MVEVPPNEVGAPHTHPGPATVYVLAGGATLTIKGQPPRSMQAGQSVLIPANTVHSENSGPAGVKELAAYVVEKGKPLTIPAK